MNGPGVRQQEDRGKWMSNKDNYKLKKYFPPRKALTSNDLPKAELNHKHASLIPVGQQEPIKDERSLRAKLI